jgi:hypothetical protein
MPWRGEDSVFRDGIATIGLLDLLHNPIVRQGRIIHCKFPA